MAFIDPTTQAMEQNAAQASAAMVAPRGASIGRMVTGYNKFQHQYAGPFFSLAMGASMHRGAQTILRGGFQESPNFDSARGFAASGMGDHIGVKHWIKPANWADFAKRESYGSKQLVTEFPRSFTRFDSTSIFNREHQMGTWNPFQLSTTIVNPIGHHIPGIGKTNDIMTQGSMSMASASSSMFQAGGELSGLSRSMVLETMKQTNPAYTNALGHMGFGTDMTGENAGYALLGANSGLLSGRAAGMYAGARAGLSGGEVPAKVMAAAQTTSLGGQRFAETATWAQDVGKGVNAAEGSVFKYAAGGEGMASSASRLAAGTGVKSANVLGDALPMLGEASLIGQAFVLGKSVTHLLKGGIQAGIGVTSDAIKSFKGSIDKPVFGMGFSDTEATKTARARGVSAIQNSRLNARSWLGSESSAMWSHFG